MNIDSEIASAKKGYEIWKNIKSKYQMGYYDYAVCFPTENADLNKTALSHVQRFAKGKYYKRIVLILLDSIDVPQFVFKGRAKIGCEYLNSENMKSLVYFLRLINLSDQMIIVSAEEPFGNLNLLGKYSISMDDYVAGTYI